MKGECMGHRERVLTALDHQEPDRLPIDLGSSVVTSIAASTYRRLRALLKLPDVEITIAEATQQIACVDTDLLELIGADVLPVWPNPPCGYKPVQEYLPDGASTFKDEFGATLGKPRDGFYYDWVEFPLPRPSIDDMQAMDWPDPEDPARYAGLRERALYLRNHTDCALFGMAPVGHDLFNQLLRVRGMENGMVDLVRNRDFAEAFLDRMTDAILRAQGLFLDQVGDLIDIHFTADDIAGQRGPLVSPGLYRSLIKPRWARIISMIKSKTKAKIFYHSCGAIGQFIPDLIDIGIDIINPVQVSADGMDSAFLKKTYGSRLCFWGGGCDTQFVLSFGTVEEVREEVRRRIWDLAPGGGFIFNPVHNIQPLVPPENVVEMFRAAREFGTYPIGSA